MGKYFCATFTQTTVISKLSNPVLWGLPCTYLLLDICMGIDQHAHIIFDPGYGSDNDSQHHKMSSYLRKRAAQRKKLNCGMSVFTATPT
jgi:hypothetical protein